MDFFASLTSGKNTQGQRIVLAEGEDKRVIEAAAHCHQNNIAQCILVGNQQTIAATAAADNFDLSDIRIVDPTVDSARAGYAELLQKLRAKEALSEEAALQRINDPLCFADLMLQSGDADGSIAGAVYTTGDRVRSAFQLIGMAPGFSTVSSFFIMLFDHDHPVAPPVMLFADCALVIEPDAGQLVDIASATIENADVFLDEKPRVALLSFSTTGSAKHPLVDKVQQATEQLRNKYPQLAIDGEVQLDAALVESVAERKVSDSQVHGKANVLIFPDLGSANIGYKLVQRLAGAKAVGPVLQGLKKPANDLSRGCSVQDIIDLVAITALQAASQH